MAVGWSGADPVEQVDADNYALGTAYKANQDVTITHVRVWAGAGEAYSGTRTGKIWSTGGAELASVTLPTDLPTGWSAHALATPVERTTNQQWVVSFDTGPNYGFLSHGLDSDVPSSDGAVTALGFANAPGTINGRFNNVPGDFPATGNASHGFYGADVQYTLGVGGNTAPEITDIAVSVVGATVTVLVSVTDAETLTGAALAYDWGDFSTPSASNYPDVTESHTYSASGTYAILVSVTDSDGATGYRAAAVTVVVPPSEMDGFDLSVLLNALATYAQRTGGLQRMLLHEPKSAITSGLFGAVWWLSIDPVQGDSGLASTSMRIEFMIRLYDSMTREPVSLIDPEMTRVVNKLFNGLHGGFTLGGLVKQVDVLGTYGPPLRSASGYIQQDNKLQRAATIYVPLIISDAYSQGG